MRDLSAPAWIIDVVDATGKVVAVAAGGGQGSAVADAVESVEWDDAVKGLSTFEVALQNADYSLLDGPLLFPGNAVTFQVGYDGDLTPKRTYKVRALRGLTVLRVEAVDPASALAETQRSEVYSNASPSDVARAVAARAGIANVVADESAKRSSITQTNESDAALLDRLASELGWLFVVDGDVLRFHAPRLESAPVADYDMGDNETVLSLDFEADWLHLPGEVASRGFDPDKGQVFEAGSGAEDADRTNLGSTTMATYERQPSDTVRIDEGAGESGPVVAVNVPDKARAEEAADAAYAKTERKQLTANLSVVGDPRVRAGDVVRITGVCKRLDGNYFVERAKHTLSRSGYVTSLELSRNAVGKTMDFQAEASTVNDKPAEEGDRTTGFDSVDPDTGTVVTEVRMGTR